MNVHVLQHVPFEDIGCMAPALRKAGAQLTYTRFYEQTGLPKLDEIDLLIIMGGPMSVNDEHEFPWLRPEKEYVREAVASGKAVLGVCLGAQLIANALGARVFPNRQKEIGWFPIESVPSHTPGIFQFPPASTVLHWHGETFDLPAGAVHLAKSRACENQAFQIVAKVIGLQFHLEATPESVNRMLEACKNELQPGDFVQSEAEIRNPVHGSYEGINRLMDQLLAFLLN